MRNEQYSRNTLYNLIVHYIPFNKALARFTISPVRRKHSPMKHVAPYENTMGLSIWDLRWGKTLKETMEIQGREKVVVEALDLKSQIVPLVRKENWV